MNRASYSLRRIFVAFCFLFLCGCSPAETPNAKAQPSTPTALDEYIAREEPKYKWVKESEETVAQNKTAILKVTSQTWQDRDWTHRVEIITPPKNDFPDTALVLASFGSSAESMIAQLLARQIGATVINVENVPNQPLYGMREDDLIAHTFQKYLETGDKTWPLLLPMTKSVIKAMDAAQEYSRKAMGKPIDKFIVAGASKRGWTSWLVAAADSKLHPNRVTGIIPLVYNNLNIPKQMSYQLESWGKFSDQIADYTRRGLQAQLSTPRGQELVAMIDPYSYRDRFTMPKLLINGTNDPYWTPDATRFYLSDLPGSTSLYWAPNGGHDLGSDSLNALGNAAAWFRLVASGKKIPSYRFGTINSVNNNSSGNREYHLEVTGEEAKSARAWVARSTSKDFRSAKWEAIPMRRMTEELSNRFNLSIASTSDDRTYVAIIAEVRFANSNLLIGSPVHIWNTKNVPDVSSLSSRKCPFCDRTQTVVPVVIPSVGQIFTQEWDMKLRNREAVSFGSSRGNAAATPILFCLYCDRGWDNLLSHLRPTH